LEWAKLKGYQKMYVSAYFGNKDAIKFYKKNGFSEIDLGLEVDL
jgi:GNAT superfamily N-acetyltransferase